MTLEGVHVLLVEDNPADARYLRAEIDDAGAGGVRLTHVSLLEDALRRLEAEVFDIVLLDLSLPDEDGLETLTRTHARAPSVPIVVLTDKDDEGLAIKAVREGAQDYLVKERTNGNLLVRAMRYATERKRAVEALERREEHFRSLIENALDLISIISADGTIRYVSPSHERVLGYHADELVGRRVLQFLHPEDLSEFSGAFRNSGTPFAIESRVRHRNGSWRVLESFGRNLVAVPGVQGIVINSRDITERKRAEDALREANDTRRAVIQTSPLAIFSVDLDNRVKSWNGAAQRMFGWQEWELIGDPLPHLLESEAERFQAHLAQVRNGATDANFVTRCRTREGRILDVNMWSALLHGSAGAVKGVVHMVADVTGQRRLQEQVHHSLKMEAVGRLAGGVAHDFNNLLTIINGYSHMLLSSIGLNDPGRFDLEEIVRAAEQAADLTKQLLAFSRRQIVPLQAVDLNSLVRNLERMLKRIIGEDIELVTTLDSQLKAAIADPGQIEQVLLNMTVNARDAMPGGGRLTIETSNLTLDEGNLRGLTSGTGDCVVLAVTDTGVGMDEEIRAHLFEPFFTTKERGKGTGLGLSTSYGFIRQNRGDIRVNSEPGKGSTFKIFLPVATQKPVAHLRRPENVVQPGDETVLLVEDDAGVRTILEAMLRRHGYEVLSCGSADEALEVCGRYCNQIHLLITDMVMPRMNGRQLSEKVISQRPSIRILYLSGYVDANHHDALDLTRDYLQKPFTPEALGRKVREILSRPPTPRAASCS